MCFGSGAPAYKKPEFGPLPSTAMGDSKKVMGQDLKDVKLQRKGKKTRSPLNPQSPEGYDIDAVN